MTIKTDSNYNDEDIDLKYIINFLLRKKIIIFGITFFGTLVGASNNYLGSKGLKYGTSMVASNNLPENLTEEQKQDLENRVEQIKKENLEDNN